MALQRCLEQRVFHELSREFEVDTYTLKHISKLVVSFTLSVFSESEYDTETQINQAIELGRGYVKDDFI